jgi:hypothetical protein
LPTNCSFFLDDPIPQYFLSYYCINRNWVNLKFYMAAQIKDKRSVGISEHHTNYTSLYHSGLLNSRCTLYIVTLPFYYFIVSFPDVLQGQSHDVNILVLLCHWLIFFSVPLFPPPPPYPTGCLRAQVKNSAKMCISLVVEVAFSKMAFCVFFRVMVAFSCPASGRKSPLRVKSGGFLNTSVENLGYFHTFSYYLMVPENYRVEMREDPDISP